MTRHFQIQHPLLTFVVIALGMTGLHALILFGIALPTEPSFHGTLVKFSAHPMPTGCGPHQRTILDRRSRLTECPVHDASLVVKKVPVRYQYPFRAKAVLDDEDPFPFGKTFLTHPPYYCGGGPREAYVSQCPECIRLQEEWLNSIQLKKPSSSPPAISIEVISPGLRAFSSCSFKQDQALLIPFSRSPSLDLSPHGK